jgi:bacterioferritin (cytochrome b1)
MLYKEIIMNEAREHFHPPVTEKATAQSVPAPMEDVQYAKQGQGTRAGDKIDTLARYHIKRWNAKELVTALRERRLSITEYRHFITRMYPLVVGFNGGLIQSITKLEELQKSVRASELVKEMQKVDHVRKSHRVGKLAVELRNIAREEQLPTLRALAGQLREEQEHNDYYRKMLEVHAIYHETYYTGFETYLNGIPIEERDRLTHEVITALMAARTPDAFLNASFPQPILAICHYLKQAAADPEVKFLIYYAIQSGIEFALVKAISESVFPGVAGTRDQLQLNPELVPDADVTEADTVPLSIKWFDEHADYGQGGRAELQHVRHGREQLNRNLIKEADVREALRRVDEVLLLWSAV